MEGVLSQDKQGLVSSFMEITAGQTVDTAAHYLQATGWNLEEAIELFYAGYNGGDAAAEPSWAHSVDNTVGFNRVWESKDEADNLASLFSPPFDLMFHGRFAAAKSVASEQGKWLIVNLQTTKEFSSHTLNRDTWKNQAVAQAIQSKFIFWQQSDESIQGKKVCTYYKAESLPVVLVIDPITGQKMKSWYGMIQPEILIENLVPFMDVSLTDYHANLSCKQKAKVSIDVDEEVVSELVAFIKNMAASDNEVLNNTNREEACSTKRPAYPPLPEEPNGDKSLLCKVGVRLTDGRRLQRTFLRTDSVSLLWSFCYAQLDEVDQSKPFHLTYPIPGGSKSLDYDINLTFQEAGLANSMILMAWE